MSDVSASSRFFARRARTLACAGVLAAFVAPGTPRPAAAQRVALDPSGLRVGSEGERYLRIAQLVGAVPVTPVGLRPSTERFARAAAAALRDRTHPWALGAEPADKHFLRPTARLVINSSLPSPTEPGPAWAGRGATLIVTAGAGIRWRAISARIEPVAFYAQNAEFPLLGENRTGADRFRDEVRRRSIDLPQRFGDGGYARVDPGDSYLRVDWRGLGAGVATEAQFVGPMLDNPVLLGGNAGGFPHAFFGTSHPVHLGRAGWFATRAEIARLTASDWTPDNGRFNRLGALFVASWQPTSNPALELGVARFLHREWPSGGLDAGDLLLPIRGFLIGDLGPTTNVDTAQQDNQLATAYARFVVPGAGLEIFGEFARNDASRNLDDFLGEPEHNSMTALGLQRAWVAGDGTRWTVLRAERLTGRISAISRYRAQSTAYDHSRISQGHTHNGQLLGAPLLERTAGVLVGVDRYDGRGRTSVEFSRTELPRAVSEGTTSDDARARITIGVNALRVRGRGEWTASAAVDADVGRRGDGTSFNARVTLGWRPIVQSP